MPTQHQGKATAPTPGHLAVLPVVCVVIAIAVFLLDTATPAVIGVAVLYVGVVLLSARFLSKRGVMLVALGCMALTVLSHLVSEADASPHAAALSNCLLGLVAIGVTAVLAGQGLSREEVLREQAGLLDLTHDTIFVRDMNDVILYWNRGAEELYGWKSDEAIGKISHQIMQTIFPKPLEEITTELLRTGRWEGILVHTKKDGTQAVVASRWAVRRDPAGRPIATLETNNDITGRKHAEDALRRSDAYLAEAQRLSLTGSFGWNVSTGEIFWSRECFRIFGYAPDTEPSIELIVQRTHPADVGRLRQLVADASREGKDWEIEHRLLMADGSIKFVRVLARGARDEKGEIEFVGAIMDVSSVKLADQKLQQAQSELAHVGRVTALGELTASIAHEVNQPITAVVANAEAGLLWLGAEPPNLGEVREGLRRIVGDGRRAGEVVRRIRALIKKVPSPNERFDLNGTILEVISLTRSEVLRHGVSLQNELASGLPPVEGDRIQLQQVILNLILNAIEAMRGVDEQERDLLISTETDEEGRVLVTVRDTGPGFEPNSAERLFTAFFTTKPEGLGMGLAICRSIIESHRGRLWAGPNKPRGAVFRFTLPVGRAETIAAESRPQTSGASVGG